MITISAPGKVHLLGEHAVVYGRPAFLAAIDKRISITISSSEKKEIKGDRAYTKVTQQLLGILEKEIKKTIRNIRIETYCIQVNSKIPIRYGLGSSASLSVSLAAALLSFLKISWDNKTIFDIAYKGEKFFHGNPSGGDLAVVLQGGFLWFRKEFEFLKTFASLPFKPHKNIKQFVLINSGSPSESTREMIEKVSEFRMSFTQKTKDLFDDQEDLTKKMVLSFKNGDEDSLVECIKLGERNLEKLGAVGKKAQSLIRTIEEIGGAAKIIGAGGVKKGSGMLLVYHKDQSLMLDFAKQKDLEILKIQTGGDGLRRDE